MLGPNVRSHYIFLYCIGCTCTSSVYYSRRILDQQEELRYACTLCKWAMQYIILCIITYAVIIGLASIGVCQKMQRKLAKSIKHARNMGYLPRKPQTLMNQST